MVEFYSRLMKGEIEGEDGEDSVIQLTFYNSGIGTLAVPSYKLPKYLKRYLSHKIDLAIAWCVVSHSPINDAQHSVLAGDSRKLCLALINGLLRTIRMETVFISLVRDLSLYV